MTRAAATPAQERTTPDDRPALDRGLLTAAYVYRNFNDEGSIHSLFKRDAERLSEEAHVIALCAARNRSRTSSRVRFVTVEPLRRGGDRFAYALECATFARRADALLRRIGELVDVVVSEGFATSLADIVRVHAVTPAEVDHYFRLVEPHGAVRRRLTPVVFRPHIGVVRRVERSLFARRPVCVVPTTRLAGQLKRWYGVPDELVHVIPYGVDTSTFRPDPGMRSRRRHALGVPEGRFVALLVGADFDRKGLGRAIAGLADGDLDGELWAIGHDDDGRFARLARELGVGDRVRVLGRKPLSELPGWYAAADAFVLPSSHDTAPLTVLEALASGLPVVAGEYAGAADFVSDGVDGYVLRGAGEPAEIATRLSELADAEVR
ncbi:MAG TPA: glycosyltransferase family 4 protein, partial [Gaiellaceae bacterium]|nr:glycosyltransferase family 4 protein [Gaiellaceae bacterium]